MHPQVSTYVVGAGLHGCLTAWKIKKQHPGMTVKLVDSADHVMSGFGAVSIHGNQINNGFHAIELPRARDFYDFLEKELNLVLHCKKDMRKMIIDGHVVDYRQNLNSYPNEIKDLFLIDTVVRGSVADLYAGVSEDHKRILRAVSKRYSNDFESVAHLLIPWFCPPNYILNSSDEGDQFRNSLRSGEIESYCAWPSSGLFSQLQSPFDQALREIGVDILLSTKVQFSDDGVKLYPDNGGELAVDPTTAAFYLCSAPVGLIRHISQNLSQNITGNPRDLYQVLLCGKAIDNCTPFTEILCCDPNIVPLSRISRAAIGEPSECFLQLEMYFRSDEEPTEGFLSEAVRYINAKMSSLGYGNFRLVGLAKSRTVYFPDQNVTELAINSVKSWSSKFPNMQILKSFGPINMAKAWAYSDDNLKLSL